jgi:hypothetical protein
MNKFEQKTVTHESKRAPRYGAARAVSIGEWTEAQRVVRPAEPLGRPFYYFIRLILEGSASAGD